MKLKNCLTLSRFNLKGSRKKGLLLVITSIFVVAVIVLVGFLCVVNDNMTAQLNRSFMKQITIFPAAVFPEYSTKGINDKNIDEVLQLKHVVSCDPEPYPEYQFPNITKIIDENGIEISGSSNELNPKTLTKLLQSHYVDKDYSSKSYIGEQLKDAPAMSCVIPDRAFAYDPENNRYNEVEFAAEKLIGKTLVINTDYQIHNYVKDSTGGYNGEYINITNISYNLNVVGVYHYSLPKSSVEIYISDETAREIEDMATEKALNEIPEEIDCYINDPYARDHILTVDEYENVDDVESILNEMGFSAIRRGMTDPSEFMFYNLFSNIGSFLLVVVLILTVIILFLSVYSNINERKSEIGLMKAVGYNSGQIFKSMYLENTILALRAFSIGGVISAILIAVINLLNTNSGNIVLFSYVMPWSSFFILALVALALILIIPLICLLIMTALIAKIPPQEAMNS